MSHNTTTKPRKPRTQARTDKECQAHKCPPNQSSAKLFDTGGLYLEATKTGRKFWCLKLRYQGKETRMSLGSYPTVTLAEARQMRDEAKKQLRAGQNPIAERRRAQQPQETFAEVAKEWQEWREKNKNWGSSYKTKVQRLLSNFLLPKLGSRPMKGIGRSDVTSAVLSILDNSLKKRRESAKESLRIADQIFAYACATRDDFDLNPAAPLIKSSILPPPDVTHYVAVTTPEELAPILRAIKAYQGGYVVKTALQLVPMLLLRQHNICRMRWSQIDLEKATLTIPRDQMKVKDRQSDFVCPLPTQALKLLQDLRPFTYKPDASTDDWVFPGGRQRSRPLSSNALRSALISLGVHERQSIHGFRATGRTMIAEQLNYQREVIEAQLDHASIEKLGSTYDRTQYLPQRIEMLQRWCDWLDELVSDGCECR